MQKRVPRDVSKITCFNCRQLGHYKKDCKQHLQSQPNMSNLNAFSFDETKVAEEYRSTSRPPFVMAKFGGDCIQTTELVLVDSGADFNCISSKFAKRLGIKVLPKVTCPAIILPDGTKLDPLGMVIIALQLLGQEDLNTLNSW